MGVYTRDHCPPHATCRDNAGNWVARTESSFLDDVVSLMDILPIHNAPSKRATDALENLVAGRLPACRKKIVAVSTT